MAEKDQMEMLSALMGEQGQDALQMMRRVERLKRLMGTAKMAETATVKLPEKKNNIFSRSSQEEMITAAIPFLDREFQKEIFVIVRLMEMRRVLQGGFLEMREKQQESATLRRRGMLRAIQPYLQQEEQNRMAMFLKLMDMKEIMGQGEEK